MTWHGVQRVRAVSILLGACWVFGCDSDDGETATIEIVRPEKDKVLTATDDENTLKDGLQYTVTAKSSHLDADTQVILQVDDEKELTLAKVAKDGAITFDQATLPAGDHALRVTTRTMNGPKSAADWKYTYRAVVIDSPRDGAQLGQLDDEDKDAEGIQIKVAVSTYAIESGQEVKLQVDGKQVGATLEKLNSDGTGEFHKVPLSDGKHELQVIAGNVESNKIKVSVNSNCASASFVTPKPSTDNGVVMLGGGDKCPSDGQNFLTDFTVSTDAGDNRDVELIVNGTLFKTAKVRGTLATFTDVPLERYNTPNEIAVQIQGAQGVTCDPIKFPGGIKLDCDGVDCSINAPQPVSGLNANGDLVQYLNAAAAGKDGFTFEVHTDAESIGKPVKLIIDGNDSDVTPTDPKGSDPNVTAKFAPVKLSDGPHTIQALCEHGGSGAKGYSRKLNWIVDTAACGVDITTPGADSVLLSTQDTEGGLSGVQTKVESNLTGNDCDASRAAPCDGTKGIDKSVGFTTFNGASPLRSTVTLKEDPQQTLCVEVRDRAGNVGRDTVNVGFRKEAPKLKIENPKDGDKYNSNGTDPYKKDSDTGSADVCNANFDVACSEIGVDVVLHRTDAKGATIATAKCQAKVKGDVNLSEGFLGRAKFSNVAFLPANGDNTKVVATQSLSSALVGQSPVITLYGDCKSPTLAFDPDACNDGQIGVADQSSTVTKDVIATEVSKDSSHATLTVTSGGAVFTTKEADFANDKYTFSAVAFGGPGTGKRVVTVKVTATDDFGNVAEHSCDASIVFDVPVFGLTAPVDKAVYKPVPQAPELCPLQSSPSGYGVTVTATSDKAATDRTAVVTVNGTDVPLTITGLNISQCVAIKRGVNELEFKLTSKVTTAVAAIERTVTLVGPQPTVGIPLTLADGGPTNRDGSTKFTWTAPSADDYSKYNLRCYTKPLDITVDTSPEQQDTWWAAARVIDVGDVKPPASEITVSLRAGEQSNCVLRAEDASGQISPPASSVAVTAPFAEHRFVPASDGQSAGRDFAAVGDVNSDGVDDLLVGGWGEAYLVFGSRTGWTGTEPNVVFRGNGWPFGDQVVGLGDFNGDGRNDFAITDWGANNFAGRVLVYYGRAGNRPWPTAIDTTTGCKADLCFENTSGAISSFGYQIAAAGRFNGDALADLAVSEPYVAEGQSGRLFVLLGKAYSTGDEPENDFFNLVSNSDDT
ncbi:MAG: hypothetical protein RL701_7525, partial [Pseudomonadota bacterium]